jgi:hypothetical protein
MFRKHVSLPPISSDFYQPEVSLLMMKWEILYTYDPGLYSMLYNREKKKAKSRFSKNKCLLSPQ